MSIASALDPSPRPRPLAPRPPSCTSASASCTSAPFLRARRAYTFTPSHGALSAKQRDVNGSSSWSGERKPGFVLLALYVVAGLLALLLNCTRMKAPTRQVNGKFVSRQGYSIWDSLRSYGGLIMDGFLLPQVLLNAFMGTAGKALSHSFYGGISAVRVAPHAYNIYRLHNYPELDLKKTYYYANPGMGFYSRAWDIIVPLAIITLAVIIFLQQRRRG